MMKMMHASFIVLPETRRHHRHHSAGLPIVHLRPGGRMPEGNAQHHHVTQFLELCKSLAQPHHRQHTNHPMLSKHTSHV